MSGDILTSGRHIPVLLNVVLDTLAPKGNESVLDATLGLGGHSAALLERTGPHGRLVGLDADLNNANVASARLKKFSDRFVPVHANFRELPDCLPETHRTFDIIFADLGLSSPHLDDSARGFSFHGDGPLDMRFDASKGRTAVDILMHESEQELILIFQEFGQLPKTHRFVKLILEKRKTASISSASELNIIVESLFGFKSRSVLPQIYQALRIAVNDEVQSLMRFLSVAPMLLSSRGRLGVISYHSLEDRLVKHSFRALAAHAKDAETGTITAVSQFELITKKPVVPESIEIENNPRARSAKFRAIRRAT